MKKKLKCYAYQNKDKKWKARCLDFNLVTDKNDTAEQAISQLSEMLEQYWREALDLDVDKLFDKLFNNKASLVYYMKYYWIKIIG